MISAIASRNSSCMASLPAGRARPPRRSAAPSRSATRRPCGSVPPSAGVRAPRSRPVRHRDHRQPPRRHRGPADPGRGGTPAPARPAPRPAGTRPGTRCPPIRAVRLSAANQGHRPASISAGSTKYGAPRVGSGERSGSRASRSASGSSRRARGERRRQRPAGCRSPRGPRAPRKHGRTAPPAGTGPPGRPPRRRRPGSAGRPRGRARPGSPRPTAGRAVDRGLGEGDQPEAADLAPRGLAGMRHRRSGEDGRGERGEAQRPSRATPRPRPGPTPEPGVGRRTATAPDRTTPRPAGATRAPGRLWPAPPASPGMRARAGGACGPRASQRSRRHPRPAARPGTGAPAAPREGRPRPARPAQRHPHPAHRRLHQHGRVGEPRPVRRVEVLDPGLAQPGRPGERGLRARPLVQQRVPPQVGLLAAAAAAARLARAPARRPGTPPP